MGAEGVSSDTSDQEDASSTNYSLNTIASSSSSVYSSYIHQRTVYEIITCTSDRFWFSALAVSSKISSNTLSQNLVYDRSRNKTFSDACFAPEDNSKSVSAMAVYINGNVVKWLSKKQNNITPGTAAAEFVALAIAEDRTIQVVHLIENLSLRVKKTRFFDDNQDVIACCQTKSLSHTRKIVGIKKKIIRERLIQDWYTLECVSLTLKISDMFTKALPAASFGVMVDMLFMQKRGLDSDPENTLA